MRRDILPLFFIIFLGCGLLLSPVVEADPLDEVLASSQFDQIARDGRSVFKVRDAQTENYRALVGSWGRDLERMIVSWLGEGSKVFKTQSAAPQAIYQYISYRREYTLRDNPEKHFRVELYIPYPEHIRAAENELITEFNTYKPPILKIDASEDLSIQGIPAKFYDLRESDELLIVLRLAKQTLFAVRAFSTEDKEHLINLARSFTYGRFNQKLNS